MNNLNVSPRAKAGINPGSGLFSRRTFLAGGAAVSTLATLAACSPFASKPVPSNTGGGKKLSLTMFAFLGGDLAKMPKEFAKEYMASHRNIDLKIYENSNSVGYGLMLAQRKADPSKPLVNLGFFNAQTVIQGIGDSMWQKLDYSSMKNASDILPDFQRKDGLGIGIGSDQYGLVINKEKITDHPNSWAALWDPKYKGELCLFNFPWYAVFAAAKLNGGGLNNMDPGWKLWEKDADQIKLIVSSNPQYLNVLSSGTAPLTSYFAGTSQNWITGGAPLQYIVPKEGAIPLPVYLESVSGQSADELEACQEIVNAMLDPKWVSRWAETSVETPLNIKSKLPSNLSSLPAFQPAVAKHFMKIDYEVVGKNNAAWTERWNSDIVPKI